MRGWAVNSLPLGHSTPPLCAAFSTPPPVQALPSTTQVTSVVDQSCSWAASLTVTRPTLLRDDCCTHACMAAGWMDVRLLAPRAELRLQIAGGSSMIDSGRLSYLGEALRALLVMEVRLRGWGIGGPGQVLQEDFLECLLCM